MSSKTRPVTKPRYPFQVKPVDAYLIASIVLEELSHDYGDVCNFLEAAALVKARQPFLAIASIEQQKASRAVTSARTHFVFAQGLAVLKKLIDPDVDRWSQVSSSWYGTEARMRKMNAKFIALTNRWARGSKPLPYADELERFRQAIVYTLGEAPPVDDIVESAHYGPGSTVDIRGRDVHFVRKVEANDCVPAAVDLAAKALMFDKASWAHVGMDPVYAGNPDAQQGFLRVMRGVLAGNGVTHDRLMFIHKNMTTMRSICAQPTCSGMIQLGVHAVVTPMLKRIGIDLTNQGWNQTLAFRGSRDWESSDPFVTLDKSDASSRIARELIPVSFPPSWSKLLLRIRTPGYMAPPELGGGKHEYEMYAGMGNGTTFAVETLIFWAATYATSRYASVEDYVASKEFAVYGDDVVLRKQHANRYIPFAVFLGFKFNQQKTFLEGPFRESCGHDYWAGTWVTPASLKCEGEHLSQDSVIGFHNTLADNRTFPLDGACARIRAIYRRCISPLIPTDPQGQLGFRPISVPHYDLVRNKDGVALVSRAWQRPRVYQLDVKPVLDKLRHLDHWSQIAVALLKARQSSASADSWSLPLRDATIQKIVPERDLERGDLVQMLVNQLRRITVQKATPWWETCHGAVDHK